MWWGQEAQEGYHLRLMESSSQRAAETWSIGRTSAHVRSCLRADAKYPLESWIWIVIKHPTYMQSKLT